MVSILLIGGISAVVFLAAGALGYFIWLKTRPKKQTWLAKIYQLGEGVRPLTKDKNGNIISDVNLQDLRPYAKDVLEKIERGPGVTIYRLQKLRKTTPAPEADVVDYWGEGKREILVLLDKDGCTLLKKGYNKDSGEIIFDPLPHSRTNIIKSEITERKNRIKKDKDILEAISPWVVGIIVIFGLISISYILASAYIEISENLGERLDKLSMSPLVTSQTTSVTPEPHDLGQQQESQEDIPLIK